jgi:hypothetical protein
MGGLIGNQPRKKGLTFKANARSEAQAVATDEKIRLN